MKRRIQYSKRRWFVPLAVIVVTSGCSLLSTKEEAPATQPPGFTQNVSTNKNEVALPVEINNDLGRIVGGGGNHFESGGSGRVNVNVNVNFNGSGWTKTVTETNDAGMEISSRRVQGTVRVNGTPGSGDPALQSKSAREPAQAASGEDEGPGRSETYVVKKGDTLMKISFEKYGNVYRWREILNANKGKIANYNSLPPGLTLTIEGVHYVVIERNGHPYLIRLHDTLGKISRKVYGTNSFWRDLWKNNPQLIHDPNRIYAGFTLYYRDKADLGQPIQTAKRSQSGLPEKRVPANNSKK